MATNSSREHTGRQTRAQEATEKRKIEEQLKQDAELKRQKKMFAPRILIGPRDILVNFNLPKIKLEEDVGNTFTVKQEPIEAEPPVIETNELSFSEIEQSSNISETIFELDEDQFSKNRIKTLTDLIDQKENEIIVLIELVNELQYQSNALNGTSHETKLKKEQFLLTDSNINKGKVFKGTTSSNARAVANLTCVLMDKHAKVRILTMKMVKLQDSILGTASHGLELSRRYQTTGRFVQESFKFIFPHLYNDFQLNEILTCRLVCTSWRNVTNTFLNNHPSTMPFDKETHLKEKEELQRGRVPIWNESPLKRLSKAHHYRFSNVKEIKAFTGDKMGTIIGSTLCLDNIVFTSEFTKSNTASFFESFNAHIKYLEILQTVWSPKFKTRILMDRIKLCLRHLPNLQHFKLVFQFDNDELENEEFTNELEHIGNKDCLDTRKPETVPKLDKLVSIQIDGEYSQELSGESVNFLHDFSENFIGPYSEQLKQVSMFTKKYKPSERLHFSKLIHISMPLENILWVKCPSVKKFTIIATTNGLVTPYKLIEVKRKFLTLTSFGFKHKFVGKSFYDGFSNKCEPGHPSFPVFPSVLTLELEDCGTITFTLLECFPNVEYIQLINGQASNKVDKSKDATGEDVSIFLDQVHYYPTRGIQHPVLEITRLWEGSSLYESKEFWKCFPNIKLVTLDCCGKPMENIEPMLCKWTREGFAKYCLDNFPEETLNC